MKYQKAPWHSACLPLLIHVSRQGFDSLPGAFFSARRSLPGRRRHPRILLDVPRESRRHPWTPPETASLSRRDQPGITLPPLAAKSRIYTIRSSEAVSLVPVVALAEEWVVQRCCLQLKPSIPEIWPDSSDSDISSIADSLLLLRSAAIHNRHKGNADCTKMEL